MDDNQVDPLTGGHAVGEQPADDGQSNGAGLVEALLRASALVTTW